VIALPSGCPSERIISFRHWAAHELESPFREEVVPP
jgi:hypothetical protein